MDKKQAYTYFNINEVINESINKRFAEKNLKNCHVNDESRDIIHKMIKNFMSFNSYSTTFANCFKEATND